MFNSREKESGKGLGHVLVVHIVAVEIVVFLNIQREEAVTGTSAIGPLCVTG